MRIHTFAVGKDAVESPAPELVARAGDGRYTPVLNPNELPGILRQFDLVELDEVRVINLTTSAVSGGVDRYPDGRFAALLPITNGKNEIEVYARSRSGLESRRRLWIRSGAGAPHQALTIEQEFMRDHLSRRSPPDVASRSLEVHPDPAQEDAGGP